MALRYILSTDQTTHIIGVYKEERKAMAALDQIIKELVRDGYDYSKWTDMRTSRNVMRRVRCTPKANLGHVINYQLTIYKED